MRVEITNLRAFVADVEIPDNYTLYKDKIAVNYGIRPKKAEKVVQIKFKFEKEEDLFKHATASCGCTVPKIHNVGNREQVVEISYNTGIGGRFSKQVNLYNSDKKEKQIINVKGEIV